MYQLKSRQRYIHIFIYSNYGAKEISGPYQNMARPVSTGISVSAPALHMCMLVPAVFNIHCEGDDFIYLLFRAVTSGES